MLGPASQSILTYYLSRMHIHIIYATVCVKLYVHCMKCNVHFFFSTFLEFYIADFVQFFIVPERKSVCILTTWFSGHLFYAISCNFLCNMFDSIPCYQLQYILSNWDIKKPDQIHTSRFDPAYRKGGKFMAVTIKGCGALAGECPVHRFRTDKTIQLSVKRPRGRVRRAMAEAWL